VRIAVISDTHGNHKVAERAINAIPGADMIIHAGDYYSDATKLQQLFKVPVIGVKGNCDRFSSGSIEETFEIEGQRIYVTHGHTCGVKYDLAMLKQRAKQTKATIAIYGHTHVANVAYSDGCLFVNPGSLQSPRGSNHPTYAIIEITGGKPVAMLHELTA